MAKPESTADTDSVILIDGSSYVYRAYHALPPLTTFPPANRRGKRGDHYGDANLRGSSKFTDWHDL